MKYKGPGCYRFINEYGKVIYAGSAKNIDRRVNSHFSKSGHLPKECYQSVAIVEVTKTESYGKALDLEQYLINKYKPRYNKRDKSHNINSKVVKIEHLRTFFNYLFTIKNAIFTEPFKKINSERKIEKKLPNYLSLDEGKRLINLYANSTNEIEIRDNAILHFFLNSGLRLSELKNLNIDDLDLIDNKFTIIGKGNKERTGYINDITRKALDEYLKIRDKLNPKNQILFVNRYGSKMSSTGIEKIVKRAYKRAGINYQEGDYCVHTLRHTCATLLYRTGADIKIIQEILGHVQIDTTEIYTHLHDQEVMNAMLEHPLSQFKMANAEAFCA